MGKLIDITGNIYEKLTVMKYHGQNQHRQSLWECVCDCGNTILVEGSNLKKGNTISCGCYAKNRAKNLNYSHGLSQSRIYRIYISMKSRCYNKDNENYKRYGGRGITIFDEWLKDFKVFYDWSISNGYEDNLSIDRIDNNGTYAPSNCRWTTIKEQSNNNRHNRFITYKGETKTLAQWCEYLNLNNNSIRARLHQEWSIERAFETPVKK